MARQKRAKQGSKRVIARGSKMVTNKREVARLWQHEREAAASEAAASIWHHPALIFISERR